MVEGNIAHRGKVVKVGVLFQRGLQLLPGQAELIILHLQFDLVDLQLMEEPLRFLLGLGWIQLRHLGAQPLFRLSAQLGSFHFPVYVFIDSHGKPLVLRMKYEL